MISSSYPPVWTQTNWNKYIPSYLVMLDRVVVTCSIQTTIMIFVSSLLMVSPKLRLAVFGLSSSFHFRQERWCLQHIANLLSAVLPLTRLRSSHPRQTLWKPCSPDEHWISSLNSQSQLHPFGKMLRRLYKIALKGLRAVFVRPFQKVLASFSVISQCQQPSGSPENR